MAYHPLTNDTGQTPEQRLNEASRILKMLDGVVDQMEPQEERFVHDMLGSMACSPKQLFYLRDLKDRYL